MYKQLINLMFGIVPTKGIIGIGGALIGGALGLIGANQQSQAAKGAANAQVEAARIAAESAKFDPYNVQMQGLGGVQFDAEGNQVSTTMDPRLAQMAGGQYDQAQAMFGANPQAYQTDQDLYNLGTGALGAAGGFLQGAQAQQPSGMGQIGQGINMFGQAAGQVGQAQGLLGAGTALTGQGVGFSGEAADLSRQGLQQAQGMFGQAQNQNLGAGQGFLNQLNQFDPQAATQTRFDQLESVLEPSRGRAREALESRLLKQGRLGSTGGGVQQEGLESAIGQQQMQNLLASTGESRAQQQQLLGMGQGLGADAMQRAQGMTGLGLQQGGMYGATGSQLSNIGSQLGAFGGQLGQFAGQQANLGQATAGIGGQMLGAGMGIEQLGMNRQQQQAGLFGQMGQFGAGMEALRGQEDYNQLRLQEAYQQAGRGALETGMGLYGTQNDMINTGAMLGAKGAAAGANQGAFTMRGAGGQSAALLGGAAGQASALGDIGKSFADWKPEPTGGVTTQTPFGGAIMSPNPTRTVDPNMPTFRGQPNYIYSAQ